MFNYEIDRPAARTVHNRSTMMLVAILLAVAVAVVLASAAFAGEPHKPDRAPPHQPAPAVIHVTPTYAAPNVSTGASAGSSASAAASASPTVSPSQSIASRVLAISGGAAVSPATCDSTVLNGLWTKESWTCALQKRIQEARAMGLGEVVLELMCMDELFRAALVRNSVNKSEAVCSNPVHPMSQYGVFEAGPQSGGL